MHTLLIDARAEQPPDRLPCKPVQACSQITRSAALRYFFHTQTNKRYTDVDGAEFPTGREARREAIRTFGQMMHDAPEGFWGSRPWSVTVTDAEGMICWEISVDGMSVATAPE